MEWIKCSDRMPTDPNAGYLTVVIPHSPFKDAPKGKPRVVGFLELSPSRDVWICEADNGFRYIEYWGEVTHWMPFPEPPKEDEE